MTGLAGAAASDQAASYRSARPNRRSAQPCSAISIRAPAVRHPEKAVRRSSATPDERRGGRIRDVHLIAVAQIDLDPDVVSRVAARADPVIGNPVVPGNRFAISKRSSASSAAACPGTTSFTFTPFPGCPLMRLVPAARPAGLDDERHGQLAMRGARALHHRFDGARGRLDFGFGHLEQQLVMHLQQHPRS